LTYISYYILATNKKPSNSLLVSSIYLRLLASVSQFRWSSRLLRFSLQLGLDHYFASLDLFADYGPGSRWRPRKSQEISQQVHANRSSTGRTSGRSLHRRFRHLLFLPYSGAFSGTALTGSLFTSTLSTFLLLWLPTSCPKSDSERFVLTLSFSYCYVVYFSFQRDCFIFYAYGWAYMANTYWAYLRNRDSIYTILSWGETDAPSTFPLTTFQLAFVSIFGAASVLHGLMYVIDRIRWLVYERAEKRNRLQLAMAKMGSWAIDEKTKL